MSISSSNLRGNLPAVTFPTDPVPTNTGGGAAAIAYYICQVISGTDKEVIVRALGCAIMTLFNDQGNIFGSPDIPVPLTGLQILIDPNYADDANVVTNFNMANPVTKADVLTFAQSESEELAAVLAMYCWTAGKTPSNSNYTAFDSRRAKAVAARCLNPLNIFGNNSPALSLPVLGKMSASLTSQGGLRIPLMVSIASRTVSASVLKSGPLSFMAFFAMLKDVGLGPVKIIDRACIRYPWIKADFPEIVHEIDEADQVANDVLGFPEPVRSFCKVIFGDLYVPVAPNSISNAFGVGKRCLGNDFPTYSNYGGGTVTPKQTAHIQAKFGAVQNVGAGGFAPAAGI